ncbi:SMP-30/gluconolactonase/LRE family protein [Jannaschia aquimarina]|uniref:Lactonase drp35 n=1 Tax=Jannaschia aquimarina TaxID=935700 RepID=A0A0D1EMY4_9RHOB|nr:SMP-30/gluconolactonase/LRE family protein [Jannaschia aquimarina]KIT17065.1 Lactonase drp35 [Jannaschia aquimarina]SNS82631.1 gluconolactonase [Jannaschia aquimarina]
MQAGRSGHTGLRPAAPSPWRDAGARALLPKSVAVFFGLAATPLAAQDLPAAWAVAPEIVAETSTYTEGLAFDADGAMFFSEPRRGAVTRVGSDGAEGEFLTRTGANGHAVMPDGTHVVMTRPAVLWLDGDGSVLHEVDGLDGGTFVFPNDLELDGQGGFWFTDSGSRTEATGAVYHIDAERQVRRVADGLAFPNGVILSDGRLFVSQSQANDVLVFDVADDLSLGLASVFAELPPEGLDDAKAAPDGMCLGPAGRLFVTHHGTGRVRALDAEGADAEGALVASYRTGLLTNSNCAFGPDGAPYVTGSFGLETTPGAIARLDLFPPATASPTED